MKRPRITEETVREACLVAGFLAFCAGLWIIYPPAALIAGGMLLMYVGLPPRSNR